MTMITPSYLGETIEYSSLLAAPHGLSQRVTSFIASQRQGIHQMPLETLDQTVRKGKCQYV